MKLRSVYHKGNDSFVGRVIIGLTWFYALFYNWKALSKNYSHEELWKPDDSEDNFSYDKFKYMSPQGNPQFHNCSPPITRPYAGKCFSSTTRGKAKGVRIAPASEVLHHPERWDFIEFEVDDKVFNNTWPKAVAMAEQGIKYDFLGAVVGFINPIPIQDSDKAYCSEICNYFKNLWGIIRKFARISPRRSAYELSKKLGREPKPLI